jgi:nucleotide-binding universal stress UspA family protein
MATHGRGKLGQITLGSVASDLFSWVDIPIFAVGPNAQQPVQHVTPKRILHPVSLAGDFRRSVCLALDVAQSHRAELTLLHVLHPDVREQINPDRTFSWAEHALRSLIPSTQDLRLATKTRVGCGDLVEQVIYTAEATSADWVVFGVDGTLPFWMFRETAAYRVLARSQCPVLTIRHAPCGYRGSGTENKRVEGVIG